MRGFLAAMGIAAVLLEGTLAMAKDPLIIAHRGASGLAPENTMPAFEKAIEAGADGIELDVHLAADGALVVHHDYRISKEWARKDGQWLAETGPALRDMTLADIRAYDIGRLAPGSKYGKRYPDYEPADGARIPVLGDVLALIRERTGPDFQLWLELKLAPAEEEPTSDPIALTEAALAAVERSGLTTRTTVISFYWPALYHAQKALPGIRTGYLSAERDWLNNIQAGRPGRSPWTAPYDADDYGRSIPATIKAAGGSAWSVYWRDLTPERLAEARALGLQVGIWTIRRESEIADALAKGADVITTDRPDWFVK